MNSIRAKEFYITEDGVEFKAVLFASIEALRKVYPKAQVYTAYKLVDMVAVNG